MKEKSTQTAFLTQKYIILKSFEDRHCTLGIFIDYSKAFDCINPQTLLLKLEHYGFRGCFLKLAKSFLEHGPPQVIINGYHSHTKPIRAGVPQGSILRPLLFNLYINDIVQVADGAKFVIYADDVSLLFFGPTITELTTKANDTLARLSSWSNDSCLKINVDKKKTFFFRPKNKVLCSSSNLMLGTICIEVVQSIKSLGVIF